MRADPLTVKFSSIQANRRVQPPPCVRVSTLVKHAHLELTRQAQYWRTLHGKAVVRYQWREQRYTRILRELANLGATHVGVFVAGDDLFFFAIMGP